jgi:hypothetical protein
MASEATSILVRPEFAGLQLPPAFVLLKTPPINVAA